MTKLNNSYTAKTINVLTALRISRIKEDAEGGVLFKANNYLYNTLADIYFAIDAILDDNDVVKNMTKHYKELSEAKPASYPAFKSNSPSIIDVAVRLVFADSETTVKRATAYSRVLKTLTAKDVAKNFNSKETLVEFIKSNGGIEGIDSDLLISKANREAAALEKAKRVEQLKEAFLDIKTGVKSTVKTKAVTEAAAELTGKHVVLVGVVDASGAITVKHVCAEEKFGKRTSVNCGKNIVKAAMNNMLEVNDELLKQHLEAMLGEKKEVKGGVEAALNLNKSKHTAGVVVEASGAQLQEVA